ncbi:Ig-like domain-containing protein [Staphylococcus equorum]|uniref:Ig-like domain-containing protein n=4 Tax=Staphylococcus TaxID=1279 RepID=UPI003CEBB22F
MKNNHDLTPNRMNKYAIRKLSVGTASLLVGSVLVFGISNDANAAENDLSKDSKALSTNVNEEDNHLVDIEKANSNEQNPVNDFSESHDIHNDNLNTSDSASEQSVVENKPTVNNTAEIDTSNKEREVAVNTTKNKVTDNKENNNNTSNVIEKEIEESKANKTNEENSEIVKTENKMKAAHNFDNSSQKFENRETSDIAEKATINQSEAQNREDISHVENNTSTKLEVKDEVNTQSENIKPASEHNVPDRNNTESVLNTKESNNAVAKVRKRRSIINRKTSSKAMTEDSAVEALEYSENYTFQTLIFDPESLAKNSVLNSKTIPFEIHSYMTGANSGDRYKINLQLDPIIANHVTRITVNPAGRTSPVQFVRLSNKQGRLTNIWQVNFIRANNGLFGGGEILSQYTASNGVIYLDTTVKNILNSMNNKHDKLNYLIYVKDNSENKKIQTSETSGYFLTAAEREINNIPPSQSTNANNSFKASSGTVQYDPKIGNFGGAIIDQQILKNGIFNYRGKILDAGLYKQWTYHYQIDPALLPYIGSIELHKQDFRGLYGFDKKYYAANKVATLRVDSKGRGSITHSDLNQLIEFNNALPETVGIRIVIKYNQSPNNILTRNASYDQNGNLISSTTQVKEDFAFYGYFTDRNGGIINNTFGSATYYIQDLDKDGLTDNYEIHNSHSDPFNGDTDRDGKNDGDEVLRYQTSPLVGKPIVNDITTEDTIIRGDVPLDKSAARQKVKILNPNGNVIKQGALNKNGTFSFNVSKLPPGKYKVAIESPNYRNAEVNTFNVIDMKALLKPAIAPVNDQNTNLQVKGVEGSTVVVKDNNNNVIGTVVLGKGETTKSLQLNQPLKAGTVLTATATKNGKTSYASDPVTVTDVTAPIAPTVTEVTSESAQVTGTGEPGSTITVKLPDGSVATGTADNQGNYAIDIPTNVDLVGNEELVVTSTDGAGNVSPETRVTVTDATVPNAPTVNEVTSEGTQVTGTGEAGSTITVKFPDGSVVTGTADNQGNYAIDIPTNVDLVGKEELVVTSTDGAGNVSPETRVIVKDTTAPVAPMVNEVTSEGTQVTGTGEVGSTITVKFPNGSVVTGMVNDQGNYAIDIPTNVDLVGKEELVVTSTDVAGNVSPETKVTVTDVTAPVAPTVNEVTSEGTQVAGSGEAGSTITVKFPDGSVVTGTADDQGNYAIDIPTNLDLVGKEELVVTSTDVAGNVSPETKVTVTDVTAPVAPTVNEVTSEGTQVAGSGEAGSTITVKFPDGSVVTGTADDQGNYAVDIPTNVDLVGNEELVVTSTDGAGNVSPETRVTVTDATAPVAPAVNEVTSESTQVTGTGEAGSTITVNFPDGNTATGTVDNQGNYAIDIPTTVDLVGNEELVVTSTDGAGNVSRETRVTVTDATAPSAPVVNEVTSEGTQVTGTGEAGSTITVKFPDGSTVTGTVDKQGNYAIDLPIDKKLNGNEGLVVTSTDVSGNVSPETRLTVTDVTAPDAPTVNEVTSEGTQVTGTGEAGSTITVKFPDGSTVTGTVDNQGNYAINIPTNVDLVGKEELVVTSTDEAGNVSPETRVTVKDTTAPVAPMVNEVTSESTQVTGTGEAGSTITVNFPDGNTATGTVDNQGNYAIDIPTTVDLVGNEELVVTSTDEAGNVSPETRVTVKDTTAPVAPMVNEVTSESTQVTGTGEAGSTITVNFPDGNTATGTVDNQGNYAIDIPTTVDLVGNEELVVTSTDGAGNVSPETKVTVTDVTAPVAPTVNEVTSEGTQVAGSGEAGSTITVKFPDGSVVTGTADDQGNYAIDIPTTVDLVGKEELVVTSTDGAGNVSPEAKVTVRDVTAPDTPTVNEVTSEDTQVTGSGEAGSIITVKFPDGSVVTGVADDQGNYAIDLPVDKKLNGNEELVVTSTDVSGNVSPEAKVTVTDVTAPVSPTVNEVTSEGTQVTGAGEPGSTITVKFPDGSVATGVADDQGNYAIDLPIDKKLNGNEELVVTSTDDSGNVSPETRVTVKDTTAPDAPTVNEVTSEGAQVTGTGEAGSTITVKFPDGSVVTGTADDQGNYAIDIPTNVDLVGNEELVVTSTDVSGNVSPETRLTVKDTTAPDAPTVNEVTSEGTQVTGTGEAGSTITIKLPDGSTVTGTVNNQGNYAIDLPVDKKLNGNEELVVTSTDGAGNVSSETKVTVTDATVPNAPTVNEVTSEGTQVTGTGEAGSTITVKFPDGSVVTGVVDDQGNYAIDIPKNIDLVGKEELVVTSTDGAGNVSPETKVTVTDTTAPVAPTVNEVTSESTQVTGAGEAGSTITVKFPDGSVVTGTADNQGNYAIDIPTNVDLVGKEELVVTSTDDSGNVSPETKVTVTDVTAPDAPTVSEVTSESTQVTGTGEAGSTITVKFPDGSVVTGTADNQGNYSIDIPTNIDLRGNEELVVTSTDVSGNVSPETRLTVTDVTAPDAPTVSEVTSEGTQVTGTGEAGSTITIKFPDGSVVTGTVDNQGNYAIDLPVDKKLNGNEELVVTSTDGVGNVSPETKVTVTDVTAPDAPTVSEVTSESTQVTGTGESGTTITVKLPDGSVITGTVDSQGNYAIDLPVDKKINGNEELVITSTDSSGNVSPEAKVTVKDATAPVAPTVNEVTSENTQVTGTGEAGSTITVKFPDGSTVTGEVDNQGNYAIDLPVDKKLNGNEELVVTSTDGAGNVSSETKVTVTDATAPAVPTINEVTSEDSQVSGTGEPGSTITVKFPGGSVVTGVADDKGNYAIDLPIDKKLKGNEKLVVTSTDDSGNVSPETRVTVKDTTAPVEPTMNEVTSENTQVTGTGEPGSMITVKFPDGSVVTGVADNQGNYAIDLPIDKKLNGNEELVVTSTDGAGNVSAETRVTVKDTTAPDAPTVNEVTSEGTQVTGTGEPGSTITVKFPDGSVVTGVADDKGNYAIDLPIDKKLKGNEELVVTSTDGAGNVSREAKVKVKDTTAPAAPTVNEVTSESTQVTGTGEPGSTIIVKFPDGSVITGTVDNQGNYVIDLPADKQINGNEELVVTSTDSSGNVSREAKVTVKDTTAPAAPTVNEVTSGDTQLTGTGEPGSTITVKFPDGSVVTGTVDNQGNYVIDLPVDKKLNGNEELVVTSTDSSGNVSRETKVTVKDATAPAAPTVNKVTSGDTKVTGTGEPGSTITVKFPNGTIVTGRADNQGNYVINIPSIIDLNPGDTIQVSSIDKSGNMSGTTTIIVNNSSVSITKQANDHDKSSNNFDLNSQLGLNGIEGEDGKEHTNLNSNIKHSDDSVNHKSGTDVASKGDVIQTNDEKGTISNMNNDKNNLDKGNNKHVDKLPTTGENENQNKGLFSSLLAMIGAFILIGRRRKNTEEH